MLWSTKLLDEQAPAIAAFAGAGLALFGLANGVVRLFGDRLRAVFGDLRLAAGSIAIAAIGFAGVGLSTGFVASVVSFALTGIGVACVVPVIFSLATAETPDNRAAGLGFIMLVAGAPRILAPWAFGWLADTYTFTGAFGAVAVLLVVAFGVVVAMARSGSVRAA